MNYTELYSAVQGYCENNFPETVGTFTSTQQINTFIKQAEQRIYNSVQLPPLRKNVTGMLSANNKYLATPNDFLSVYSLAVITNYGLPAESYEFLLNKDVNFIRQSYPGPNSTGKPKYYAIFGPSVISSTITTELSFIVGPIPDASYFVEMHYYYYPASIVAAGTTWLGDNFDSALLYGALMEAASFMKAETDTINVYTARYGDALAMLKRLGDGLERGDAYRDGQARVKVT